MDFANTDTFTVGQSSMEKRLSKYRRDRFEQTGRVTSMSLGRYLLEEWLPRVELSVEPVTSSSYRTHVEQHINPYLGHVRVGKLDRVMIQNLYATLLHEKSPKTKRPLSKSTVIRIHGVLHCALEDLVFSGRRASNPARGARSRRTKSEQREHRDLDRGAAERVPRGCSRGQVVRAVEAPGSDRHAARRGNRAAMLRSATEREAPCGQKGARHLRPGALRHPNESGLKRVIDLDGETVRVLRSHLRHQKKTSSDDWVFTKQRGGPLSPDQVTKAFQNLVASTDLPHIRLHDLRHTHASHLILAGVNMKTVQERLGHSDVVITLKFYSHVLPTTQREAVRKLERLYSR